MEAILQSEWYSVQQCRQNPKKLYVFGDNLIEVGKGGQAIIRDEPNSFGIPTKRLPSMSGLSFFGDREDEFKAVDESIEELLRLKTLYTIVFPKDGLGTGLAKMDEKSPKLFKYMNDKIKQYFGVTL